jgi:hypothetical protein
VKNVENICYVIIFSLFVGSLVSSCAFTASEKIFQSEAIENGAAQYNSQTGDFEWIKK